jgi:hypothetical protein
MTELDRLENKNGKTIMCIIFCNYLKHWGKNNTIVKVKIFKTQ